MKTRIQPIERERLSDQIIKQMLHLMDSGNWKIGDKLPPEHVLMTQLRVGRSSLREAIRILSLIGVLTVRPGHGTVFTGHTDGFIKYSFRWEDLKGLKQVEEIIEARIFLEQSIISLVIEKATDEDLAELEKVLQHLRSTGNNREDFVEADLSFHLTIAKISHNRILMRFMKEIRHMMRTWMESETPLNNYKYTKIKYSIQQHTNIFSAIKARDIEAAMLAIREHLRK